MMVQLHLRCWKDHLSQQLCLHMTLLEDKLEYWMSTKSQKSTLIQWRVMRIVHLKPFGIQKVDSTVMVTSIIQIKKWTIARQRLNCIWSQTMVWRIRKAQSSGISVLHKTFLHWIGLYWTPREWLKCGWWQSMQLKLTGIR
jgi:hypothetical protein